MNLEESDLFKKELESNNKKKRTIIIGILVSVIIIILLIVFIFYINYTDKHTHKLFINRDYASARYRSKLEYKTLTDDEIKSVLKNYGIPEEEIKIEKSEDPNKYYFNIKSIGEELGYKYFVGLYEEYDIDQEAATLQNTFEYVSLKFGENYYEKRYDSTTGQLGGIATTLSYDSDYVERYKLINPILKDDSNNLYVSLDDLVDMLNITYKWGDEYWKYIISLDYIVNTEAIKVAKSFKGMSLSSNYDNLKALKDGYYVMSNGTGFGVFKAATSNFILSQTYADVVYKSNIKEFFVTVDSGNVGLADDNGKIIINPNDYEKLSLIDDTYKLFQVGENTGDGKNTKYGVYRQKISAEKIIPPDYDEIGYSISNFPVDSYIGTKYLWFNKYIPVKAVNDSDKYGLYTIDGNQVLTDNFNNFGYISKDNTKVSALVIPKEVGINAIVVGRGGKYGLFDINKDKMVLHPVIDAFYSKYSNGKRTFYYDYGEDVGKELSKLIDDLGLRDIDKNGNYFEGGTRTNDGNDEIINTSKFNSKFEEYKDDQDSAGVNKLIKVLINNAEENANNIKYIPNVEFYDSISSSMDIEPNKTQIDKQESYCDLLNDAAKTLVANQKYKVKIDYNEESGLVSKITIKPIDKSE